SRPARYETPVHEAPALVRGNYREAPAVSRMTGSVADIAHKLDRWSQAVWHRRWERLPLTFTIMVTIAVGVASLFEIIPTFLIDSDVPRIATVKPYTPLELHGRDLYISEGCYNCHSQMIRPILAETKRYGEYSKPGEFIYDHPFQWGSRRIGPDLAREGGKQSALWHLRHFENPRDVVQNSIMPRYEWFLERDIDYAKIPPSMAAMVALGVPYSEAEVTEAVADAHAQAATIARQIAEQSGTPADEALYKDKQVLALIAYLERLGTDLFATPDATAPESEESMARGASRIVDPAAMQMVAHPVTKDPS
ncbi:MAG: cytochrome-c oxidase, cbb3-type subunit II, partial [Thermomicrobiales bacterium]